jgi:hypothetical protein
MSKLFRNHDNDARVAQLAMATGIAQLFMAVMGSILLALAGWATKGAIGGRWVKCLRIAPLAVPGGIWAGTALFCHRRREMPLEKHVQVTFKGLWAGAGAFLGLGALYLARRIIK